MALSIRTLNMDSFIQIGKFVQRYFAQMEEQLQSGCIKAQSTRCQNQL